MAETHETSADIIAEMETERPGLMNGPINTNNLYYARRLKAALERERGDCAKLREAVMEANNNSKAREVLNRVHEFLSNLCRDARCDDHCSECLGASDLADDVYDLLHTPPRNCDVGTAQEQAERWYWRYHVGHLCQSCPLGPRKWSEVDAGTLCFSEWQQMPYEEGGVK